MMQKANIGEIFKSFFDKSNFVPDTIIELGTFDGKFSNIIYDLRNSYGENFKFMTFDHYYHIVDIDYRKKLYSNGNFIYEITDIFDNVERIGRRIVEGGKTLLLCDNGNKVKEVQIFSDFLKSGDVIMAHDYAYDQKSFEENKYWTHLEIQYSDVAATMEKNNLEFFHCDITEKGAWLSLIKN